MLLAWIQEINRRTAARTRGIAGAVLLLAAAGTWQGWGAVPGEVTDRWGRSVVERGIVLVDWEGQIANPALEFQVSAAAEARFPVLVQLQGDHGRLYFDLPSRTSLGGPRKRIGLTEAERSAGFRISIFPDRDGISEEHELTVTWRDGAGEIARARIPIQVVDQDMERAPEFQVIVDASQDTTGFFADPAKLRIAEQAAQDWAYFIADMNFDVVPRLAETSYIWAVDGSQSGRWIQNAEAYEGFLLYVYGFEGPSLTSGGQGSWDGGFQRSGGVGLRLRRSGTYQAHVEGNYNRLGWFLTESDEDWLVTRNFGNEQNDLYSIAHHEVGHTLFFDGSHPLFAAAKAKGGIDTPAVRAYHGGPVMMDEVNHFPRHVDRVSGIGAFGNEYGSEMPPRRWLITKLDLLCAEATGYRLRPTSAFEPARMAGPGVFTGRVGEAFEGKLEAAGGIPSYHWRITGGRLPPGVELDSFGVLAGVPEEAGRFEFDVALRDYDALTAGQTNQAVIEIEEREGPRLVVLRPDAAGKVRLRVTWPEGGRAQLEESVDLKSWRPVGEEREVPFEEVVEELGNWKFYRAVSIGLGKDGTASR